MMFRVAVVAFLASAVSALKDITPNGDIAANSALGMRLLSQAEVITPARQLNEQQEERDVTFIMNYAIRYLGCHSLISVGAGNANNNKNNQNQNLLYTTHLARFALCPIDSCSKCEGGGEYVMNMETFVDAYTETLLTEKEYQCETVREGCNCEGQNDDQNCEAQCYADAGIDCAEAEGQENFEVQRYLQCQQMEGGNNNGAIYYTGPYCSAKDGFSIHLGVFTDMYCNSITDPSVFETINGVALPFHSTSLVSNECHSCKQTNNNGYDETKESCVDLYENTARCEAKMDISNKDDSGCEFINSILPKLTAASKSTGSSKSSSGKGATAFAVIFAFTTCMFAAYAYFLYRKIKRGSVDLSSQV